MLSRDNLDNLYVQSCKIKKEIMYSFAPSEYFVCIVVRIFSWYSHSPEGETWASSRDTMQSLGSKRFKQVSVY